MYNPQLETFIKVADTGSFSKAGEELYITSIAIIKQINLLEERLEIKLFERTHRGVKLTEAGKILYKESKYIIKYSRKIIENIKKTAEDKENLIRIGTSQMTPEKKLIELWTQIKEEFPELKIKIVVFENTPERAKDILHNMGKEIDIVAAVHDDNLLGARNYATTKLFDLPLCAAVSINHSLASKEKLDIEDLYDENVMLIHRGWNKKIDELRNDMEINHPRINIIDFDFFSLELFNQCENSNSILVLTDNFNHIHPLLKLIPVNWGYKVPFEMIHSSRPSKGVQKFIKAVAKNVEI